MAKPNSRSTLIDYCLRALGAPVIEINLDDDQIGDRIDEALQFYQHYHADAIEKVYLKHQITQSDIDNQYIPLNDLVTDVVQIFPLRDNRNTGDSMFDVRYQLRLNDLYDFSSTSIVHYEMTMRHLDFLDHILVGEKPMRFNHLSNRLFIDMDWGTDIKAGEYLIIEVFRKLDPDTYTDIYDDIYLKRYATALIKRQWGANLSKFQGIQMLGGVALNGEQIYTQAQEQIEKLEEQIQLAYELPPMHMIG